jgi:tetratricopeptide (TPR) repeat protein
MTDGSRPDPDQDHAQWTAVEEISELLHEERFHEALPLLRAVLEADRRNSYAFHLLGVALYEVGELEAARDAYRACVAIAPDHRGARVHLSHCLRELGDLRAAIKEGLDALSRFPDDGDAMHAIGLAYLARGDGVAAKRYLEAYLATGPEFEAATEVRTLLAALDLELDKPKNDPPS